MDQFKVIITNVEKLKMLSKNFHRDEFACKCGCSFSTVDVELLEVLELIRKKFNKPIKINSACRCDEYNKKIGGSYGSKHRQGVAADIVVKGINPETVYNFINNYMPNSYGIGKYNSFTHIDVRNSKARWKG